MSAEARLRDRWVALSGGVGGAKLALGLSDSLGSRLTVIVNTGDDFEHLGLHISPDIDTAIYTLAGLANPDTGWGRRNETWTFMRAIAELGGPDWFKLGDGDLAMHVERTRRLRAGESLTSISREIGERLGIAARIVPMSDDRVRTLVETEQGALPFQDYFVREQCRPMARAIRFEGAEHARPSPAVIQALSDPGLAGVIVCPSNPYLSIDPILAVPGIADALRSCGVPVIAVTPIIGGKAVKGPAAKIMGELNIAASPASVARHYAGLIHGFVFDVRDQAASGGFDLPTCIVNTLMTSREDKVALARACLDFCEALGRAEVEA